MKKIKESLCYSICTNNISADSFGTSYILPDGNSISLKDERVLAPEVLFNPSMIGLEHMSFTEMISNCLSKVDIDIRKNLYQHILMTGGNTLFKGLPEKLKTEVGKVAPKLMRVD